MFLMNKDFPGGSDGNASVHNAGDLGSIPGWVRFPWRKEWLRTIGKLNDMRTEKKKILTLFSLHINPPLLFPASPATSRVIFLN